MKLRVVQLCIALGAATLAQAKNFRWSSAGDVTTQDPHGQDESFTKSINAMIYERLLMPGRDMSPTPWLATSYRTVSPTQRIFQLRRDVKFQDGTPLTADDVVFSFERAAKSKQFRTYTSQAGTARKIDDYTVEFTTAAPNPIAHIAIGEIPIMSRAWAAKNNSIEPQDFSSKEPTFASRNAMGSGPFRLVSYEPGVRTVLAKNPDWWGIADGRYQSNIETIEYRPIASSATRMAALKSGEIDFVLDPPVQDIAKVKEERDFRVWEGDETRIIAIALDQARDELLFSDVKGKNPFKDKRVRAALYHAIDIEAIRSQVMRGLATPTAIAFPNPKGEGIPAALDKRLAFDPARARALLAEAGYPTGFAFTLHCPNDRYVNDERICTALAAMWARVGLNVKVDAMPKAIYIPKALKRDVSATLLAWGGNSEQAIFILKPVMRSPNEAGAGVFNWGGMRNDELDRLIDRIEVETESQARLELVQRAVKVMHDEVHVIPIHRQKIPWAGRDNVSVVHMPNNWLVPIWVRVN